MFIDTKKNYPDFVCGVFFLMDSCIISVHLAIVFTLLPLFQFCCCVKLNTL